MKVNLRDLNLRVNLMRLEIEFEFRDFCKLPVRGNGNRSVFVPSYVSDLLVFKGDYRLTREFQMRRYSYSDLKNLPQLSKCWLMLG